MVHTYLVPAWFLGYGIILQLVFGIITILVSIFAFRISRLSGQRQPRLFATAFTFISLAYFIEAGLNFLILSRINEDICLALKILSISTIDAIGIYSHVVLFAIGLTILAYMTFRIKSFKTLSLLLITGVVPIFFTENPLFLHHILSSILLAFVVIHYLAMAKHLEKKKSNSLTVFVAFILLLVSNIHFLFSVMKSQVLFYLLGDFIELAAYLLILTSLLLVQKNEQKKRPAPDHP